MTRPRNLLAVIMWIAAIAFVGLAVPVIANTDDAALSPAEIEASVVPSDAVVPPDEVPSYAYIAEPAEIYPNHGVPAIHIPAGTERLTIELVLEHLRRQPHPYTKYGTTAEVIDFSCHTIGEINALLRSNIPAAKATPACVVTFRGEFVHDHGDPGMEPTIGDFGYQIFDQVTGNLYSTQFKNSAIHHIP